MKRQVAKLKVYPEFELEKIKALIKEWCRLSGIPLYEELDPELEKVIQGNKDGRN